MLLRKMSSKELEEFFLAVDKCVGDVYLATESENISLKYHTTQTVFEMIYNESGIQHYQIGFTEPRDMRYLEGFLEEMNPRLAS